MEQPWWLPLIAPDEQFERGIPPRMLEYVKALRQAYAEVGPQRGMLVRAHEIAGGLASNFHASLHKAAKRLDQMNAVRELSARPLKGMTPRQITRRLDASGKLLGSSIQERPAEDTPPIEASVPGFAVSKVSTYRSGDGEIIGRWTQERPEDADRWRAAEERIVRLVERVPPAGLVPPPPEGGSADLLCQVTLSDSHVGALGWQPETGAPHWDLEIARRSLMAGSSFLIHNLPHAEEIVILVLGDYHDTDGFLPLTPASKHLLDVDGRFPKIAMVGEEVVEQTVLAALTRFQRVRLVFLPGNHDPLSTFWLRRLFTRIFQNNPRVTVDPGLRNIWVHEFGKTLVTATHGDHIKMSKLPSVVSCDFAEQWGRTTHRYGHTGHLHHEREMRLSGVEQDGMTIYQHPTLASRNFWAANLGLSAARQLVGHCYRRQGGMAGKLYFHPDMMEKAA